jgi:hypothetical protein
MNSKGIKMALLPNKSENMFSAMVFPGYEFREFPKFARDENNVAILDETGREIIFETKEQEDAFWEKRKAAYVNSKPENLPPALKGKMK